MLFIGKKIYCIKRYTNYQVAKVNKINIENLNQRFKSKINREILID